MNEIDAITSVFYTDLQQTPVLEAKYASAGQTGEESGGASVGGLREFRGGPHIPESERAQRTVPGDILFQVN